MRMTCRHEQCSERPSLHDVRNHASAAVPASLWLSRVHSANGRELMCLDEPPDWWSQTGSNRRPPACKAGALPAELWPRKSVNLIHPSATGVAKLGGPGK